MTHFRALIVASYRWIAMICLPVLACAQASVSQDRKSVREDLAEAQRLGNYSLADVHKPWEGQVFVVSVADRKGKFVKTNRPLTAERLRSPDGKLELFRKQGLWLRYLQSGDERMVDPEGYVDLESSWSPDSAQFVFSSGGKVRVFHVRTNSVRDLVDGHYASWSPDGHWIAFDQKGFCLVISPTDMIKRRLFKLFLSEYGDGASWSPDGRFLTYTKPGGPSGGFLFWGIKCIEPYRAWVVRVADGASDWVFNTCKPGFNLGWVKHSDLVEQ